MKYTISAFAYYRDGGDGGGSTRVYGSLQELKDGVWPVKPESSYSGVKTVEEQEERYQECIEEDDPYENGEISEENIQIEIGEDGVARLAAPLRFHWGQ